MSVPESKFRVTRVFLSLLVTAFFGCAKPWGNIGGTDGPISCNQKPQGLTTPSLPKVQKVLFIVDKSGSNVNSPGAGGVGNDPNNIKRASSIEDYIEDKVDNRNYQWGFIAFGAEVDKAESWINRGQTSEGSFGDSSQLQDAISKLRSVKDNGCTPYLNALALAKNTISKDIANNPNQDAIYNIFFISDGFPTDQTSGGAGCNPNNQMVSDLASDPYLQTVKSIKALSPQKIFLSTVYYADQSNDPSRTAAQGLGYMAKAGGGNFIDLSSNGKINFASLQIMSNPPSGDDYILTQDNSSQMCL